MRFLNLRGDQQENVGIPRKAYRLIRYYGRLVAYARRSKAKIFHILWNNKIEIIDRTCLMLLYRICGRRIVLTAHNVNVARRDGADSAVNRLTLRVQYGLCDHVFVHTEKMREELLQEFGVAPQNASVIPFALNNEVPATAIDRREARQRLKISCDEYIGLIFGQIAPYKGVEIAIRALPQVLRSNPNFRLLIAGKIKRGNESYWSDVRAEIERYGVVESVTTRIEHIPDCDVELYFKAADVLVMPYLDIFQSGLPFLAYSFGLPIVSTDAGSLAEYVVDGQTGFVCRSASSRDLALALERYFSSRIFAELPSSRDRIRHWALNNFSSERVALLTVQVYERVDK